MNGDDVMGMCAHPGCLHSALLSASDYCPVHKAYEAEPPIGRPSYAAEYDAEPWA